MSQPPSSSPRLLALVAVLLSVAVFVGATDIAANDELAKGLFDNAISLAKSGKHEQALEDFRKVYTAFPDSEYADRALFEIGKYYFEIGQLQQAGEAFDKLIQTYEGRRSAPAAYYYRGLLAQQPRYSDFSLEESYANFSRVVSIYPRSDWAEEAHLEAGRVGIRLGDYDAAGTTLSRMIDLYSPGERLAEARLLLGYAWAFQGEPIRAMEILQSIRDEDADSSAADIALQLISDLYRFHVLAEVGGRDLFSFDRSFSLRGVEFSKPWSVAVKGTRTLPASEHRLFVADYGEDRLFEFDGTGELVGRSQLDEGVSVREDPLGQMWFTGQTAVSSYFSPQRLSVREKEAEGDKPRGDDDVEVLHELVTANRGYSNHYLVIDEDFRLPQKFSVGGDYEGPLDVRLDDRPQDMAFDHLGRLYLVDARRGLAVSRFLADGQADGYISMSGKQFRFDDPYRIALGPFGHVYVLDEGDEEVVVFDSEFNYRTTVAFADTPIKKPVDIAVDAAGRLYVVDPRRDHVYRFH